MATPKKTRGRRGILNDVLWVYENLNSKNAKPPSDGAKMLLDVAIADPAAFFDKHIRKLLPAAGLLDKWDQQSEEASAPHMEKLDKLIEEFRKEHRGAQG